MTFRRLFISRGELNDAKVQQVVDLAIRDSALMAARKRVLENMAQVVGGKIERDDDLLDDLLGKLLVEVKRVAAAAYPRTSFNDWQSFGYNSWNFD